MKIPLWFRANRFFPACIAIAAAIIVVAVAFGLAQSQTRASIAKSKGKDIAKLQQARLQFLKNKLDVPGPEQDPDAFSAALDEYEHRAYPANDVPFKLTVNAQNAFVKLKSRKNKSTTGS